VGVEKAKKDHSPSPQSSPARGEEDQGIGFSQGGKEGDFHSVSYGF
jgi:hypothetical protein